MKATVYYVELNNAQVVELNSKRGGWGSKIGTRYLAAKDGKIDSTNFDLIIKAAIIEALNAEEVWIALQNSNRAWSQDPAIECHTDFPRSMDKGDLIIWENGHRQRCESVGFSPIG